ncbi:hypothetical protein ACOACO_04110 [Nocardioides sp. CPCC 205120]|uniref:hypothetical protein n=1 Tax=Nocardioides sp. CPCC 205120 TaxID=3406462 RepID=UPI003B504C67
MVLGGLLVVVPWVVLALDADGPAWVSVVAVAAGFVSLFLGAVVGPPLGVLLGVLRERRWGARHPSGALRPVDVPGVAVVPASDDVLVLDPFDRHGLGGVAGVTLRPYDVPRDRWPRGVVLSATGCAPIVVPGTFEAGEVAAFCSAHGIRLGPPVSDPGHLPRLSEPAYQDLRRYGGHHVRSLSPRWVRLRFLPLAVLAAGAAALALGASALVGPALPVALTGTGLVLLVAASWALARIDCACEFTSPATAPEPAPVRG